MSELYYSTFVGLSRHFKGQFDYIKYAGSVKYSKKHYLRNATVCGSLSRKFNNVSDFKWLCIANLQKNPDCWLHNLLSIEAKEIYQNKLKIIHGLSYTFEQDLKRALSYGDFDSLLKFIEDDFPVVYHLVRKNEINLESLIVLDRLLNLFDRWSDATDDLIFHQNLNGWNRYKVFIDLEDKIKYKKIIIKNSISQKEKNDKH